MEKLLPPDWLRTDVSRAAHNPVSSECVAAGDVTYQMSRMLGYCAAAVRGGAAVAGGVAAVLSAAPPASLAWVLPAVLVNVGWAGVFTLVAVTRGLVAWVMITDVVLTSILCLGLVRLVAPEVLPAGASWVSVLASMTIVAGHLSWRPRVAVPAGVVVAIAYAVGAQVADAPDGGLVAVVIFVIQNVSTAVMMALLRKVSRFADTALDEHHEAQRASSVQRARRTTNREQNRQLHDTVLATLTMVGTGAIPAASPILRARAAEDLAVIERPATRASRRSHLVPLGSALRDVAKGYEQLLSITVDTVGFDVADAVADAFAGAVGEALMNVVRHARVSAASLRTTVLDGVVRVEVTDCGRGFDTTAVPAHHYGIRESVTGRMRTVGGDGRVVSAPEAGTRVELWWPDHDG